LSPASSMGSWLTGADTRGERRTAGEDGPAEDMAWEAECGEGVWGRFMSAIAGEVAGKCRREVEVRPVCL
jgi:hypothetical protein